MKKIDVIIEIEGQHHQGLEWNIPEDKIEASALLPFLYALFDKIMGIELHDKNSSCKKGCGFCCKQLVPLSIPEVFHLCMVLESLSAPLKRKIKNRLSHVKSVLQKEKLYDTFFNSQQVLNPDEEYFKLNLECPFLESNSCSIYSQRPFVCREYNVASQPSECKNPYHNPSLDKIKTVWNIGPVFAVFSALLYNLSKTPIPHIVFLDWAERAKIVTLHQFPGTWMIEKFFNGLQNIPVSESRIKKIVLTQ